MSHQSLQDELSELSTLADSIYTAVEASGNVPVDVGCEEDEIYWEVAYPYSRVWPTDDAANMLAEWRVERYGL